MAPDLPTLSGGLKVIYHLAERLSALGLPACVWHGDQATDCGDLLRPPLRVGRTQDLEPGDLLVMPEVGGGKWSTLNPGCPAVMLVQGIDFVFADATFTERVGGRYPGWPQAAAAIGTSEAIVEFLECAVDPGLPIHHVPLSIDLERFTPGTKERWVAFMPRRRRVDLLSSVQILHRRGRFADGWRPVPIDGLSEAEVALVMGRSAVFLSGAEREGFGLPGAEAMAAGCLVIGYTGHGAREYLTSEVAVPIAESDTVALADAVERAMIEFDTERAAFDEVTSRARQRIVGSYAQARQDDALREVFGALAASDSPCVVGDRRVAHHFQAHAPRGPMRRAVLAGRTAAGSVRRRVWST